MPKLYEWTAGVLYACLFGALFSPSLHAFDLEPKLAASRAGFGGAAVEIAVSGPYAYVVVYELGFQIVDISDPRKPQVVGNYQAEGYAMDMIVSGHHAYLATQERLGAIGGLEIVDISDPAQPRRVGTYPNSPAKTVTVFGNHAYLAGDSALRVLDIADLGDPQEVGSYPIDASAVAISGNYAYVVQLNQGLRVLDISDPANPELVGTYQTNGYFQDVVVSGNHVCLADRTAGLHVIDVSEPTAPRLVGKYASSPYDLARSGNYVYLATEPRFFGTNGVAGGLHIVAITDPTNPRQVGWDGSAASSVAISDHFAFVVDGSSLACIDVADPSTPTLVGGYSLRKNARDVALAGAYAYVADGLAGLDVFELIDPANPKRVGGVFMDAPATSVALAGSHALLVAGSVMHVFNISDPAKPVGVGHYDTSEEARKVAVAGDFAYVVSRARTNAAGGGLHVVDIRDPGNPQRVGHYASSTAMDVALAGNYAYLTVGPNDEVRGALEVIDIRNSANPVRVSRFLTSQITQGVAVSGDYAYVADGFAGVQVINVSDPAKPEHAAIFRPSSNPVPVIIGDFVNSLFFSVKVVGDRCYAAEMFIRSGHGIWPIGSSVQIIDISVPARPRRIGSTLVGGTVEGIFGELAFGRPYDFDNQFQGMVPSGNRLWVAGGGAGLQAVDLSLPAPVQMISQWESGGYAPEIAVAGNYAYVAEQRRWNGSNTIPGALRIVDVRDTANPTLVGTYPVGEATDVEVSGTNACVLADEWLRIIDISNPANPRLIGGFDTDARLTKVAVSGNYAYGVAKPFSNRGGLHVIHFNDPANPQRVGYFDHGGEAFDVAVSGAYAYVAQGARQTATNQISGGLQIISIANPANPQRVGAYHVSGSAHGVVVSGGSAYLVGPGMGLHIIDVSNPSNPQGVGVYAGIESAERVLVSGDVAYVTDADARLHVLDIRDPGNPTRLGGNTSMTGFYTSSPTSLTLAHDKIYAGVAAKGMHILHPYRPVRFQPPIRLGTGIRLQMTGPPGVPGRVQRSGDLHTWSDWRPVIFGETPLELSDPDGGASAFYRIAVP